MKEVTLSGTILVSPMPLTGARCRVVWQQAFQAENMMDLHRTHVFPPIQAFPIRLVLILPSIASISMGPYMWLQDPRVKSIQITVIATRFFTRVTRVQVRELSRAPSILKYRIT